MTDTNDDGAEAGQRTSTAAEDMLRPFLSTGREGMARLAGLGGELPVLVAGMAQENAQRFAEAMTAVTTAKTPLDGATIYSRYLMEAMQRVSRQFLEVTQAASAQPPKSS